MTSKATRQSSALQQLLQSIQLLSCPSYSAAALLRVMSQVNGQVRRRRCLQTLLKEARPGLDLSCRFLLSVHSFSLASSPGAFDGAEQPIHSQPAAR